MPDRRRLWRAVDADLFRFTTTDLGRLHIALMAAFEDAAVLVPALNIDDVRTALMATGWDEPVGDEALQRALESLVGWGLLEATQDHAAQYATPECSRPERICHVASWRSHRRSGVSALGRALKVPNC